MDLTPEERRRIYEEEKAKAEEAELRQRVYEEEKARIEAEVVYADGAP